MKRAAVYCASNMGGSGVYAEKAAELANWLSGRGYDLVYGGSNVGLMKIVADTMLQNGRAVTGVLPAFLQQRELAHTGLTELILVKDMRERKSRMLEMADCYIALPGGPGTLEEISEVISWGRLGRHSNPCILYDINGFYSLLGSFFDTMVAEGFLPAEERHSFLITSSLREMEAFIARYPRP